MSRAKREQKVQATVRLPRALYEQARRVVTEQALGPETINEFFVAAIRTYLQLWRRKEIDAAFAKMSADRDYQERALRLEEEFAPSDWEALQAGEKLTVKN